MNQFVAKDKNGRAVLGLILEPGNIERLGKGDAIRVHADDFFPDGIPRALDIVIFYSETPIADARKMASMADVVLDERTAQAKAKRPHCPECKSTIEQVGCSTGDSAPVVTLFCPACGCSFGILPKSMMGDASATGKVH